MERLTHIEQHVVNAVRSTLVQESTDGHDDDLDPADRKDRTNVAERFDAELDAWVPVALARDDDVMVGAVPGRIVGPARGREWVSTLPGGWLGSMVIPIRWDTITAHAPVDPAAEPIV